MDTEARHILPSPGRLYSEENGFDWCGFDYPGHFADCVGCQHDRQPTAAELSKRRSMERKWRKAAKAYPCSPAAVAVDLIDTAPW